MIDDPGLVAEISAALVDAGYDAADFDVVQQSVSGSRQNYLLQARRHTHELPTFVWCRASSEGFDTALGRFTLAREAMILRRLTELSIRVPQILGSAPSGRAHIQRFIDGREPADAATRALEIERMFVELDRVYALSAGDVFAPDELASLSAADAVQREVDDWIVVAERLLASGRLSLLDRDSVVADAQARVERVLAEMTSTPVPVEGLTLDVVHGDAGRANYLVDAGGDVWLLDWELAHAGSRLEDFAWIELRGLEQDEAVWRHHILQRLSELPADARAAYRYFRMLIYFRSVVAIAARVAADPSHPFVPYLARRFTENEALGWSSAATFRQAGNRPPPPFTGDPADAFNAETVERWHSWQDWTHAIDATLG